MLDAQPGDRQDPRQPRDDQTRRPRPRSACRPRLPGWPDHSPALLLAPRPTSQIRCCATWSSRPPPEGESLGCPSACWRPRPRSYPWSQSRPVPQRQARPQRPLRCRAGSMSCSATRIPQAGNP